MSRSALDDGNNTILLRMSVACSLHFIPAFVICSLPFTSVCILRPVCSPRPAFYTDLFEALVCFCVVVLKNDC